MQSRLDLDGMALFVRIVENGSLSAAARALGLPKATVSRRLVQLETSIGSPLLARSTRALSMTDAGHRYFERVQPIVHEAEAAQSEIMSANTEPSGILRLTAPIIFGEVVVAPGLVQFLQRYPKIQADLHFSDEPINIIAEGYDLAIRMGQIEDRDLISRADRCIDGAGRGPFIPHDPRHPGARSRSAKPHRRPDPKAIRSLDCGRRDGAGPLAN